MDIVTRRIVNYNHKYTGTILLRLCKRSHLATIVNRAWVLNNKLRSSRERFKVFLTCHKDESSATSELYKSLQAKISKKNEGMQIRSILENSQHYKDTLFPRIEEPANVSLEEISELYGTNWSSKSADEILRALKLLAMSYSSGTRYESPILDSVCEACLGKLPKFEDSQIKELLQYLITLKDLVKELLVCDTLITALNKECIKRFYPATVKQLLLIMDAFSQLDTYSDYIECAMKELCSKPQKLDSKEFVQTSYYLQVKGVRNCTNVLEMEYRLGECIHECSANEIGIIARGFFLNKKKITDKRLMSVLLDKLVVRIESVDSVSIAYVMKLARYSSSATSSDRFKILLSALIKELPRLSLPCLTHITHAFGTLHTYNETLTNSILKIALENINHLRLKDMERIIFGICTVAPYTDYYTDICHKFLDEVLATYKTKRRSEIDLYTISLIRIVLFLTMRNIYVPELLQYIYGQEYLRKLRNVYPIVDTVELLILHCSVKIEMPRYKGPLLPPTWYKFLIEKFNSKHVVHNDDKTVRIKTEIVYICKNQLGINVSADYIIPCYYGKDIIFAMDEQDNPVDVELILSKMPQGSIKSVNNDELKSIKWHTIVFVPQTFLLDHGGYVGYIHRKLRQLSILGYTPILIHIPEWDKLREDERESFLRKLIYKDGPRSVATKQCSQYERECFKM